MFNHTKEIKMAVEVIKKTLLPIFLLVISGLGITTLQYQVIPKKEDAVTKEEYQRQEEEQKVAVDMLLRSPSLGFGNILANWAYLNFIQYFGDTPARNETGYGLSPRYFQAVVERDPRFVTAYSILDPATSLFAGRAMDSVKIMNQGLESLEPHIKNAYLVWSYKGIDELLFLGKGSQAQKSYEMAAKWGLFQGDETSVALAQRFGEMAEFLKKNKDSKQAQAGSWLMVLSNAKDQKTIQLALDKIRELGGVVTLQGNKVSIHFPE